ncbi:hypothetical protein EGT73_13995 [Acinetobacter johnsonii]|uniref:Uncharacterized protein n=1 Tax=Acinetobacter johnsonii TaxID=40214 RepID=A0A427ULQ2_ACIJO|nr:hypothetical protein EGT73_13995 [Acinetobacter johnsonii]
MLHIYFSILAFQKSHLFQLDTLVTVFRIYNVLFTQNCLANVQQPLSNLYVFFSTIFQILISKPLIIPFSPQLNQLFPIFQILNISPK